MKQKINVKADKEYPNSSYYIRINGVYHDKNNNQLIVVANVYNKINGFFMAAFMKPDPVAVEVETPSDQPLPVRFVSELDNDYGKCLPMITVEPDQEEVKAAPSLFRSY